MMELFCLIHEECQESSDGSILLDPLLLFDVKYKYLEDLLFSAVSALELQTAQLDEQESLMNTVVPVIYLYFVSFSNLRFSSYLFHIRLWVKRRENKNTYPTLLML